MTVNELINYGNKSISLIDSKTLIASMLEIDIEALFNHLDDEVSDKDVEQFKKNIELVLNDYPIQYIINSSCFFGYDFYVDNRVLIPRFETEELVFNVSEYIKRNKKGIIKILDLCCGSGIIGITLSLLFPQVKVTCADISKEALEVTKINSKKHNVAIEIIQSDLLENINDKYDIIISNPPYIALNEEIEKKVVDNEPSIALYGGVDGTELYEKILSKVKKNIRSEFLIAFEIGFKQKNKIKTISRKYLENIKTKCLKDMSGKDRIFLIVNK